MLEKDSGDDFMWVLACSPCELFQLIAHPTRWVRRLYKTQTWQNRNTHRPKLSSPYSIKIEAFPPFSGDSHPLYDHEKMPFMVQGISHTGILNVYCNLKSTTKLIEDILATEYMRTVKRKGQAVLERIGASEYDDPWKDFWNQIVCDANGNKRKLTIKSDSTSQRFFQHSQIYDPNAPLQKSIRSQFIATYVCAVCSDPVGYTCMLNNLCKTQEVITTDPPQQVENPISLSAPGHPVIKQGGSNPCESQNLAKSRVFAPSSNTMAVVLDGATGANSLVCDIGYGTTDQGQGTITTAQIKNYD